MSFQFTFSFSYGGYGGSYSFNSEAYRASQEAAAYRAFHERLGSYRDTMRSEMKRTASLSEREVRPIYTLDNSERSSFARGYQDADRELRSRSIFDYRRDDQTYNFGNNMSENHSRLSYSERKYLDIINARPYSQIDRLLGNMGSSVGSYHAPLQNSLNEASYPSLYQTFYPSSHLPRSQIYHVPPPPEFNLPTPAAMEKMSGEEIFSQWTDYGKKHAQWEKENAVGLAINNYSSVRNTTIDRLTTPKATSTSSIHHSIQRTAGLADHAKAHIHTANIRSAQNRTAERKNELASQIDTNQKYDAELDRQREQSATIDRTVKESKDSLKILIGESQQVLNQANQVQEEYRELCPKLNQAAQNLKTSKQELESAVTSSKNVLRQQEQNHASLSQQRDAHVKRIKKLNQEAKRLNKEADTAYEKEDLKGIEKLSADLKNNRKSLEEEMASARSYNQSVQQSQAEMQRMNSENQRNLQEKQATFQQNYQTYESQRREAVAKEQARQTIDQQAKNIDQLANQSLQRGQEAAHQEVKQHQQLQNMEKQVQASTKVFDKTMQKTSQNIQEVERAKTNFAITERESLERFQQNQQALSQQKQEFFNQRVENYNQFTKNLEENRKLYSSVNEMPLQRSSRMLDRIRSRREVREQENALNQDSIYAKLPPLPDSLKDIFEENKGSYGPAFQTATNSVQSSFITRFNSESMSGGPNPPPQEGTFTRIGEKVAHIATTQFSNIKDNIIAGASVFKDGFQTIGESRGRDDGTFETTQEKQASMERQNQAFDRIDATAKDALIKNIQAHKQIHEDIAHITEDVAGITVGAGKAGWEITKELGELLKTGARIGGAEMLYDSDVLSEQKEKYYASQQGKEDCELLIGTSKAVVNQTINTAVGTGKMVYHAGGLRGVEEQKNEDWSSLQELNERNLRLGLEQEKHNAGLVEGFDTALPATSHFIRNINDPNRENIGGNFAHAALETTSVIGSIKTAGALINKTEKLAAQTLKGKAPLHPNSLTNVVNTEVSTLSEFNTRNAKLQATTITNAPIELYNSKSQAKGKLSDHKIELKNKKGNPNDLRVQEIKKTSKIAKDNKIPPNSFKIDAGKQNKHNPNHPNYGPGKSQLIHDKPQELVYKFAGKGIPLNEYEFPKYSPNYKEKVDAGKFIGYAIDKETKQLVPTNKFIIAYAKDGVHIYPTQ